MTPTDVKERDLLANDDGRDGLTGLSTRRVLVELAMSRPLVSSLAYLDLDRFKNLNQDHSYLAGDEVLRQWGAVVTATVGSAGTVGRWGGEELVVLLPGVALDAAQALIEQVLAAVRALEVTHGGATIRVTCSAGLVEMRPEVSIFDEITRADEATYQAKRAGRDRIATG